MVSKHIHSLGWGATYLSCALAFWLMEDKRVSKVMHTHTNLTPVWDFLVKAG